MAAPAPEVARAKMPYHPRPRTSSAGQTTAHTSTTRKLFSLRNYRAKTPELRASQSQETMQRDRSLSRASDYTVELNEPPPPLPDLFASITPNVMATASKDDAAKHTSQQSSILTSRGSDHTAPSVDSGETDATSVYNLPALQTKGQQIHDHGLLEPVPEDDPTSYDLVATPPSDSKTGTYSLERRVDDILSEEHLQAIFDNPQLLQKFSSFLGSERPQSIPLLIYYLDAVKALRAIKYANAISEALEPLPGQIFTKEAVTPTQNSALEERARMAFQVLVREELPAYVTYQFSELVSVSVQRKITNTMAPHLREASEGLAETFCVTDPQREDNPIIFASEEFHRTTQYGVSYAIQRNCRFLQGPKTSQHSRRRIKEAIAAGRDHMETFINYRRDGTPFMNLLMLAALRDNRGILRYFIGAQIDVSGLVRECANLPAVQGILSKREAGNKEENEDKKEVFQELSEMFNAAELDISRRYGGTLHREYDEGDDSSSILHRPRLLLREPSPEQKTKPSETVPQILYGKLAGVYRHFLLVRPYPSLRILFTSPSLRVPGILQSPFMDRIGSSERVRNELISAFAEGRGVTAKVRWILRNEDEGRNRWIHCTPLLGGSGAVGIWMIILVDEESSYSVRRFKEAPPVPADIRSGRPRDDWELPFNRMNARHAHGFERADRSKALLSKFPLPVEDAAAV